MEPDRGAVPGAANVEVIPLVVLSQTFPARPSSIPDIREFVRQSLARSPLSEEDTRDLGATVSQALLEAAGPTGTIQVSFRIFPDHAEVDVLRSQPATGTTGFDSLVAAIDADRTAPVGDASRGNGNGSAAGSAEEPTFADWMGDALRREGLTMEAAARQLGVSVKTISRWVGGATEPRLRDLRRIRDLFGEIPLP
jgi:helix-turn-helix protein